MEQEKQTPEKSSKRSKVLLVEDSRDLVGLLREAFIEDGWTVFIASDGVGALEIMGSEKFDAIISDVQMPFMNGVQLLKRTKSHALNKRAKFFIMSGHLDASNLKLISALGVASIVIKPFDSHTLVRKVRAAISEDTSAPKKATVSYNADIIRSVVTSLQEVVEFYLGSEGIIGKPYVKTSNKAKGYFTAMMSLNQGEAMGSIAFSADMNFLKRLHHRIFQEELTDPAEDMIRDLAGEMCNQISGKIKIHLAKHDFYINIGLPQVIVGEGHEIIHLSKSPVIVVPMEMNNSKFCVEFTMSGNLVKSEAPQAEGGLASGGILFD